MTFVRENDAHTGSNGKKGDLFKSVGDLFYLHHSGKGVLAAKESKLKVDPGPIKYD